MASIICLLELLNPKADSSLRWIGRPLSFFSKNGRNLKRERKLGFSGVISSEDEGQSYVQFTFGGGVLGSPLAVAAAFARLQYIGVYGADNPIAVVILLFVISLLSRKGAEEWQWLMTSLQDVQ